MKISIISDVHGNIHALEAIYKDLRKESVDSVAFLGDLVMSGPHPVEVYDFMDSISPDIWIKGNSDDCFLDMDSFIPKNDSQHILKLMRLWAIDKFPTLKRDKLLSQPIMQEINYGNFLVNYCHGTPNSYSSAFMPDSDINFLNKELGNQSAQIILCGHSHLRFSMYWNNFIIKNFGSVSLPNNDLSRTAKYGIMHIDKTVSFIDKDIEYNFTGYINDMKSLKFPGIPNIFPKYGLNV
ncbi:MAG: metallophosphatase family protein [Spirochaetaceae bacterium]